MNNKTIIAFGFRISFRKNYGDLGGSYPPRPINTLLHLHNNSDDTQLHPIIVSHCISSVKFQLKIDHFVFR